MPSLRKINRKLEKVFGGRVRALSEDGCLCLEGELDNWDDLVRAGIMALDRRRPLVNRITFTPGIPSMELPPVEDTLLDGERPDVLVIGGGVTGCAAARELARHDLKILLVEKEHDLAMHASSRNDGMVHPGLDLRKGSAKYRYNKRGNAAYDRICGELGVPFRRTGQYLCFSKRAFIPILYLSLVYWKWLGVPGARLVLKKELHRLEPGLGEDLAAALFFPTAGVVCPYGLTIAYGENAVENGVKLSLDTAVLGMDTGGGRIASVKTNRGTIYPGVVINAAGVFAEDIAAMAGDRFYSIHPRRGTNSILDKKYTLIRTIASKMFAGPRRRSGETERGEAGGSAHTKGGGMIRTVHGNLLVGPDAVETPERENFATQADSIAVTFAKFRETCPALSEGQVIASFTGIRAPTYEEDFVVSRGRKTANLVHAAGIQSPGLTAAPAIAEDLARFAVEILNAAGRSVGPNRAFNPFRKPIPHTAALDEEARHELIQCNPDYGVILCRCEEVSRGEILDALRRPVPCDTLDGVKRRVRPGGGRCQGAFCGPLVLQLIAAEKGIPLEAVTKNGAGSELLLGEVKGDL
ncbi:MAG: NAD(P)/FAD-dependent oxidoreductase [Treponema sp.]|jgi:glycerol-3-phosphate dehydrogenase|nr:NAD(P)/FAD-dependent oxidoreductase [Treponema sp.]